MIKCAERIHFYDHTRSDRNAGIHRVGNFVYPSEPETLRRTVNYSTFDEGQRERGGGGAEGEETHG